MTTSTDSQRSPDSKGRDGSEDPLNESSAGSPPNASLQSLSDEAMRRCIVETRAAIDVIFEMLALNHSDGDEDLYRETLFALKQRHQQAVEAVRSGPFQKRESGGQDLSVGDPLGTEHTSSSDAHLEAVDTSH